jgi:hypothetical protein
VLWDGQKLYVVSRFADTPAGCRFYRFSYYADAKLYVLDQGYPVDIPGGATESITLAKDSQGRFWVAFTLNEKVWTAHSLADDRHWSAPYVLPVPEGTSLYFDDIAGVVALPGKIGIFWSNQLTDKDYFAVHTDGAADTAWSLEIPVAGNKVADDHFNLKLASDGRLFVAMKTSRDGANGQTLIGLLVRSATGVWSTLNQVMPNDFNPTRAQLLLDEAQRRVYVFYSPMHATIHYKVSSMDTIAFPTGIGTPFIAKPDVSDINDPTTTKQNIDPSTGMVVLASNFVGAKFYYHNAVAPLPAPAVTITAPATGGKSAAGTTITFSGTASSADLGDLTASLRWTSSVNGQIGTGGSFSTQSLSAGAHVITASVTDARGVTRSASIALAVETNVAPVVTIQSPQNNKKFLSGATVTFNATALDSLDGDRSADARVDVEHLGPDRDGAHPHAERSATRHARGHRPRHRHERPPGQRHGDRRHRDVGDSDGRDQRSDQRQGGRLRGAPHVHGYGQRCQRRQPDLGRGLDLEPRRQHRPGRELRPRHAPAGRPHHHGPGDRQLRPVGDGDALRPGHRRGGTGGHDRAARRRQRVRRRQADHVRGDGGRRDRRQRRGDARSGRRTSTDRSVRARPSRARV